VVGHTPRGKSPFGIYDLAGNAWEWCLDRWADAYVEIQTDNVDPCHHRQTHDGDTRRDYRVIRGGSWDYGAAGLRTAYRFRRNPTIRLPSIGIRVVCGGARQPR
jgi:formylglycine-generating enzyme required for sulfatase activity